MLKKIFVIILILLLINSFCLGNEDSEKEQFYDNDQYNYYDGFDLHQQQGVADGGVDEHAIIPSDDLLETSNNHRAIIANFARYDPHRQMKHVVPGERRNKTGNNNKNQARYHLNDRRRQEQFSQHASAYSGGAFTGSNSGNYFDETVSFSDANSFGDGPRRPPPRPRPPPPPYRRQPEQDPRQVFIDQLLSEIFRKHQQEQTEATAHHQYLPPISNYQHQAILPPQQQMPPDSYSSYVEGLPEGLPQLEVQPPEVEVPAVYYQQAQQAQPNFYYGQQSQPQSHPIAFYNSHLELSQNVNAVESAPQAAAGSPPAKPAKNQQPQNNGVKQMLVEFLVQRKEPAFIPSFRQPIAPHIIPASRDLVVITQPDPDPPIQAIQMTAPGDIGDAKATGKHEKTQHFPIRITAETLDQMNNNPLLNAILDKRHPNRPRLGILWCNGKKWSAPINKYACCGTNIYELGVETCPQLIKKGRITTTFAAPIVRRSTISSTREPAVEIVTCGKNSYPIPISDTEFYACCEDLAYFWPKQRCVDGHIVKGTGQSPPATTPAPKFPTSLLICGSVDNWVDVRNRLHFGCCGTKAIDLRVEKCNHVHYSQRSPSEVKMADEYAGQAMRSDNQCPPGYICCPNFSPIKNINGELRCCFDNGPYDPSVSSCVKSSDEVG